MSREENKRIVESMYIAGNSGDLDACFALLAEDVIWTVTGSARISGTYTGKRSLMEDLLGPLFGSLKAGIHSEIEALLAEDDCVVALTRATAETLDGVPYNNSYCHVFRIRDGKIVSVVEYLDTALAERVFGSD